MIQVKTAKFFFDKKPVIDALGKEEASRLSKMGSFVRRSAKSSIRPRKNPSPAGRPPSSHLGLLRDLIFFSYDTSTKTVVVGPEKFDSKSAIVGKDTIPGITERGGTVTTARVTYVRLKAGRDNKGRFKPDRIDKRPAGVKLTYPARPYMGPALETNVDKFPQLFKG